VVMAMTTASELPDDPATLKAMLLAERARASRLEQIIKELQRHRFGRRAETLPEDQLLLGLEEAEQVEASGNAEGEQNDPAKAKEVGDEVWKALKDAEKTMKDEQDEAEKKKAEAEAKNADDKEEEDDDEDLDDEEPTDKEVS